MIIDCSFETLSKISLFMLGVLEWHCCSSICLTPILTFFFNIFTVQVDAAHHLDEEHQGKDVDSDLSIDAVAPPGAGEFVYLMEN